MEKNLQNTYKYIPYVPKICLNVNRIFDKNSKITKIKGFLLLQKTALKFRYLAKYIYFFHPWIKFFSPKKIKKKFQNQKLNYEIKKIMTKKTAS